MASKYLDSLSGKEYEELTKKLHKIQNGTCYICQKQIDLSLHKGQTNIDHIIPLANGGKDQELNFALTHESCNKSKQDADLRVARVLAKLREIREDVNMHPDNGNKTASLKHVLLKYDGSKYEFPYKIEGGYLKYSFPGIGDNTIYESRIMTDYLSQEQSVFIEVPIEYIFHDELINPRGINSSINLLVKEFFKGNPQLHLSLARIVEGKIKIFDGQHKAVAQILLGNRKILLRVFLNPNVDRLIETNTNAGSKLRQIAFDKSIMRQLHNTLYADRIRKYQEDHHLSEDDYNFSEEQLVEHFKGEVNLKKYIIDSAKHQITHSDDNQLKDYIDFEGRGKELPISYSSFEKTFLAKFLDSKRILSTPLNYRIDEGKNPRELEQKQLIQVLNIIAEEIYINKFNPEVGVFRLEQRIVNNKDSDISDEHLVAYRMGKEEIMYNWLEYLKRVIENFFANTGRMYDKGSEFQNEFPEQLWINITNFIRNLKELPLWKDKSLSSTVFSGKQNYSYWETIFKTGKTIDGVQVLAQPLNYVEMICR